jgi:hypothetical protein
MDPWDFRAGRDLTLMWTGIAIAAAAILIGFAILGVGL